MDTAIIGLGRAGKIHLEKVLNNRIPYGSCYRSGHPSRPRNRTHHLPKNSNETLLQGCS